MLATGGCWSWRGRIGKAENAQGTTVDVKGPLPDFKRIPWTSRRAIIFFDANPNDSVLAARHDLARVLRQWGADVRHAHLPNDDPQVNGPDDFLAQRGDAALWAVIDKVGLIRFSGRLP